MKNGFTLMEMIGVVTVLAVLMMISVVPITKSLKEFNETAYQTEIDNIEQAAKLWGQEHPEELPQGIGETRNIYLSNLQNDGYLENNIINPKTNKKFDNLTIVVTKESELRYTYEIQE